MVGKFIQGLFGRGKNVIENKYNFTEEELNVVKSHIERRLEEEKMERITRSLFVDAVKTDSGSWEVVTTYGESRQLPNEKPEEADISIKSIGKNLDSTISDGWYTIVQVLSKYGGNIFKLKES